MKDTWNIFIIGPLSRKDEIQKAATYYLDSGYYVRIMKKTVRRRDLHKRQLYKTAIHYNRLSEKH